MMTRSLIITGKHCIVLSVYPIYMAFMPKQPIAVLLYWFCVVSIKEFLYILHSKETKK